MRDTDLNLRGSEPPGFSEELRALLEAGKTKEITLDRLIRETSGRQYYLVLLLLALPFITPVPLPGISMPVGLAAAFLGVQIAAGKTPWLPKKVRELKIRDDDLKTLLRAGTKIMRILEHFLRPRLLPFTGPGALRRLAAALIAICGVWLVLPLPLPFSNSLPALTILLFSAAELERDGFCFLAGCGSFALAACYFIGLLFGGAELLDHWPWWRG